MVGGGGADPWESVPKQQGCLESGRGQTLVNVLQLCSHFLLVDHMVLNFQSFALSAGVSDVSSSRQQSYICQPGVSLSLPATPC